MVENLTQPKHGKRPAEEPPRDAPPHDLQAERAVLGSVLCSPELLLIASELDADCYYSDAHKWIARALVSAPHCDIAVVASWLKDCGRLEQVGRTQYLSELLDVPFVGEQGIRANCEIIRKKWQLRLLKTVGAELVALDQRHRAGEGPLADLELSQCGHQSGAVQ